MEVVFHLLSEFIDVIHQLIMLLGQQEFLQHEHVEANIAMCWLPLFRTEHPFAKFVMFITWAIRRTSSNHFGAERLGFYRCPSF